MSATAPTPRPPLVDAADREQIVTELDRSFVVEASAGTGKTTALIGRIVALLESGRGTLDRLVAVTFTNKAAGEMKLRLRAGVERARQAASGEARWRLDRALAELETARISTIDSLCADLLRERPIEAGVDPGFDVHGEAAVAALFEQAFSAWYRDAVASLPAHPGVRRVLAGVGGRGDTPREVLHRAARGLIDRRDWPAPWSRPPFERDARALALLSELRPLGAVARRAPRHDALTRTLEPFAALVHAVDRDLDTGGAVDLDALEARLHELARQPEWRFKRGRGRRLGDDDRAEVLAALDAARATLARFATDAQADLAALLQGELAPVGRRYERAKEAAGVVDFLDLLLRTRRLLTRDPGVRHDLQRRFDHLLVDEFQDTSPLQAEILLLLAADDPAETDWRRVRPVPGKLFIVGDPKQSIYRFRRADVGVYERVKAQLIEGGAAFVQLRACFRCVPGITTAVNAAFALAMAPADGSRQARYAPLEPVRSDAAGRPALVALPVPAPFSEHGYVKDDAIEDTYPKAVGAFVAWLLQESGWTVDEPDDHGVVGPVPVAARHVCLLFRRMAKSWGAPEQRDVAAAYAAELGARGVPHVLASGHAFHRRAEVQALVAALTAIEWPDDELAVYATLRGPFFGFEDADLLVHRARRGRSSPVAAAARARAALEGAPAGEVAAGGGGGGPDEAVAAVLTAVDAALAVLGELHHRRNRRPIADTVTALLDATRAHAGLLLWDAGHQTLGNVLRVVELARRFESGGGGSFRAFAVDLAARAEGGDTEETLIEDGIDGVRLMTAHKAKGLEFPVVVLCDPTARSTRARASDHVDPDGGLWAFELAGCAPVELVLHGAEALARDAEESVRLAYVAATRARDLLVVPVVADEARASWVEALYPAVYPSAGGAPGAPPEGCPPFGIDTVLARPGRALELSAHTIRPGVWRPRAGEHAVLWWDPCARPLDVEPASVGRERAGLLAPGTADLETQAIATAWEAERARVAERAGGVAVGATPMGAVGEADEAGAAAVIVARVARAGGARPDGALFGNLVHGALATVPLDASDAAVEAAVTGAARLLGARQPEVAAAVALVRAALADPWLARARGSADVRRETPVTLPLPDGRVAEGVVDLAFRDEDGEGVLWTVIDYKTAASGLPEAEGRQRLGRYVQAVAQATGERARGVLLML